MQDIIRKIESGERIDTNQAQQLFGHPELLELGMLAQSVRLRKHPEPEATFIVDRNINYTNICQCQCRFCAFYVTPEDPAGYWLDRAAFAHKIQQTRDAGGNQILLQGGLHPDKGIEAYEQMLREIKTDFPGLHIHAFGSPEIHHIARISGIDLRQCLHRLRDAGLDSIPGGGAEILVDSMRASISPNKINSRQWLDVMETAHNIGMRTTATMMFGAGEQVADRLEHLQRLRDLQDRTGGFTAFIPWSYQPDNTELGRALGPDFHKQTSADYLRLLAIARIFLDNIDNIQASWVTQGRKIAQLALHFGANDFGSLMLEENVVKSAGVSFRIGFDEMLQAIRTAGFRPVQRDLYYNPLATY